ncbi:MAG: ABC transporter ATP-binding protein [Thermoplasmata archaeon]|nr:MAG: ABC transporter ATP-binding protein [Thermoplasmata archaeon]
MLKALGIRKAFDGKVAVSDINLEVRKGEIYGILGMNGAGKSTTMKICAGILRPDSGRVLICGVDIVKDPVNAKKKIGYVPEAPVLYNKITGREFLELIARSWSMGHDAEKYISLYTKRLNMLDALDDEIGSYSKGMVQKLCIIGALIHRPSVYILDEPTAGLDPVHTAIVKDMLREEKKRGASVFLSTHIVSLAHELCDRIGIIHKGRIIVEGSVGEILAKYHCNTLEEAFMRAVG